jgi:4-carboxymuconolactone decarboxylase
MGDPMLERGVAIKTEMFGADHGQVKIDNASDFTRDFEVLVAKYCFGEAWGREGLTRDVRSMLTIAMLIALGKSQEVRVHVAGAIANGVTKDQIREVIIHASIYCGIPAGVDAFRNASAVLDELGVE